MIFEKFPPNTFIPYPTFIILRLNVHPICLFHILPLLGTLEYIPDKTNPRILLARYTYFFDMILISINHKSVFKCLCK